MMLYLKDIINHYIIKLDPFDAYNIFPEYKSFFKYDDSGNIYPQHKIKIFKNYGSKYYSIGIELSLYNEYGREYRSYCDHFTEERLDEIVEMINKRKSKLKIKNKKLFENLLEGKNFSYSQERKRYEFNDDISYEVIHLKNENSRLIKENEKLKERLNEISSLIPGEGGYDLCKFSFDQHQRIM